MCHTLTCHFLACRWPGWHANAGMQYAIAQFDLFFLPGLRQGPLRIYLSLDIDAAFIAGLPFTAG